MEQFFTHLKTEWVAETGFHSYAETKHAVIHYMIVYYSQVRPHQQHGGLLQSRRSGLPVKGGQFYLTAAHSLHVTVGNQSSALFY